MDAPDGIVNWQGELLWPTGLAEGRVIDLSRVEALGVWAYAWFRQHPRQAVVGANIRLREQLTKAGLPILWYGTCEEALGRRTGVSPAERAMLWEDPP